MQQERQPRGFNGHNGKIQLWYDSCYTVVHKVQQWLRQGTDMTLNTQKQLHVCSMSEWVIKFNSLFGTVDIRVPVAHTSHVFIAYTLELTSLTYITHNMEVMINFKQNILIKKTKSEGTH